MFLEYTQNLYDLASMPILSPDLATKLRGDRESLIPIMHDIHWASQAQKDIFKATAYIQQIEDILGNPGPDAMTKLTEELDSLRLEIYRLEVDVTQQIDLRSGFDFLDRQFLAGLSGVIEIYQVCVLFLEKIRIMGQRFKQSAKENTVRLEAQIQTIEKNAKICKDKLRDWANERKSALKHVDCHDLLKSLVQGPNVVLAKLLLETIDRLMTRDEVYRVLETYKSSAQNALDGILEILKPARKSS